MKNKNIYLRYIPMSLAAAFLLFFAVKNALYPAEGEEVELWYHIFKTLPTIVTLFVQLLMMSANRYAFLLGGCNSVIYGIVYFMEDVPFSGISALVLSFLPQIYSFFNWGKNSRSGKVSLRRLSAKYMAVTVAAFAGIWSLSYFWLAKYMTIRIPLLDTLIFSLGIITTALAAVRYIDSQYISFISCIFALIQWILLTVQDPSNINFVIIAVYNLYCVGLTAINWTLIYIKDKKASEAVEK